MIYRDQLEAVYKLIERPETWTQHEDARDAHGEEINPSNIQATCWCLSGAIAKAGFGNNPEIGSFLMPGNVDDYAFIEFNDTHTHAEVLALLKSAIDRAPVRAQENAS